MLERDINRGARAASLPGNHRGLTLVELLVAISVLAFVAILGWRGLDGIVRARIALTGELEQTRGMQLTFAQLQSDCAHLASPVILPNRAPLVAGQERLSLVRTVFADDQPSRLQVVTYRVQGGVLTRRESAATRDLTELDTIWQAAANDTGTERAVALQSGVSALTMRLWVSGSTGWRTAAEVAQQAAASPPLSPVAGSQPLLSGLEVAMQLQGSGGTLLKIFLLGAV